MWCTYVPITFFLEDLFLVSILWIFALCLRHSTVLGPPSGASHERDVLEASNFNDRRYQLLNNQSEELNHVKSFHLIHWLHCFVWYILRISSKTLCRDLFKIWSVNFKLFVQLQGSNSMGLFLSINSRLDVLLNQHVIVAAKCRTWKGEESSWDPSKEAEWWRLAVTRSNKTKLGTSALFST